MTPLTRWTGFLALTFFIPEPAAAEEPPSFGARPAGPSRDQATWPANARIRLGGEQFDASRLSATVDGAPARLFESDRVLRARSFGLSPEPVEGQAVHIEGDTCPAEAEAWGATCAPLVIDYVAGPPLPTSVSAALPRFAFDVFDHGTNTPEGCGDALGGVVYFRFESDPEPLGDGLSAVATLNGHRIMESDLNTVPSMHTVLAAEESGGDFCLAFFVESLTGARGPVTESCTPCRARVTDAIPANSAADPAFTRDELVNPEACLPSDGFSEAADPVEPTPPADVPDTVVPVSPGDAVDAPKPVNADAEGEAAENAPDADAEAAETDADDPELDGGCSQRPCAGNGIPWAVALLALRRRRRR